DFLGTQYMYKSGYDPQAYVNFFEKVEALEKKKPGSLAKAFSSHPQSPDRIANTQKEIASILPAREQYVVSTSEFDQVKSRLALMPLICMAVSIVESPNSERINARCDSITWFCSTTSSAMKK